MFCSLQVNITKNILLFSTPFISSRVLEIIGGCFILNVPKLLCSLSSELRFLLRASTLFTEYSVCMCSGGSLVFSSSTLTAGSIS